ncbi:hypothetical protein HG530_005736 [Fusarium avenaceum]|nr:hypothetical protein HG530_005736 [Fusarium avenaceum]
MLSHIRARKGKLRELILSNDNSASVDERLHTDSGLALDFAHLVQSSVTTACLDTLEVVEVLNGDSEA